MAPIVPFVRSLYPPSHQKGAVPDDIDVVAVKRAISRAGFFPWNNFDNTYSEMFAKKGVKPFQQKMGLPATGIYNESTHLALRNKHRKGSKSEWAFDLIAIALMHEAIAKPKPLALPPLGPMYSGGKSILNHALTHSTSGINLYPAFDDVFGAGRTVIAPEPLLVMRASTSNPGRAFYADGRSGIRYWFAHLTSSPRMGTEFKKGQKIGTTINAGTPHCHTGVNVEKLWGKGKELIHHDNYTYGAPTIGDQLAARSLL